MKKILLGILLTSLMALTACGVIEVPDGFTGQFYDKSVLAFAELDEDVQEMEMPDRDDLANFEAFLATNPPTSQKEEVALKALQAMFDNEEGARHGDRDSLRSYLQARQTFVNVTEIMVDDFEFTEEDL